MVVLGGITPLTPVLILAQANEIPYTGLTAPRALGIFIVLWLVWRMERSLIHDQRERIKQLHDDVERADNRNNTLSLRLGRVDDDCRSRVERLIRLLRDNEIEVPLDDSR